MSRVCSRRSGPDIGAAEPASTAARLQNRARAHQTRLSTRPLPFEDDTKRAANRLGLALKIHQVSDPADLATAFSGMEAERVQAVFVLPDVMFAHHAQSIAQLALQHRLPTMTWASWFTTAGCLMAYSSDYTAMNHRLAYYVDRILKGVKPGDLPIEQPTTFTLWVNLRTAQALGIEVPQSVLLLADEVIE
ncbi:MAG: ABC transporter substrate-binding protein [Inquilinus sp.]|uniref:ABC transporter substrate-binding protein n=1 Tax=Inquilinus sp. TaxID=1932117 RepID=UPI003F3834FD